MSNLRGLSKVYRSSVQENMGKTSVSETTENMTSKKIRSSLKGTA